MAYESYTYHTAQPGAAAAEPPHNLYHQPGTPSSDQYANSPPMPAYGRQSIVSLPSPYGSPTPDAHNGDTGHTYGGGGTWSSPFTGGASGRGYEPVSVTGTGVGRGKSFLSRRRDTIYEDESIDMSLLSSAAPFGIHNPYEPVPHQEATEPVFDVTASLGPMDSHDQEFIKSLQQQEANGKLTGGLGQGLSPDTRMTGNQLLAVGPTVQRGFSISRAFSTRAKRRSGYTDREAIKDLGQSEANKRGEVIEVVMQDAAKDAVAVSEVDLSTMVGPDPMTSEPTAMRRPTFPASGGQTEVFYPQPNWKPFSMTWPYLVGLILLSAGLGVMVELLYQRSKVEPLLQFTKPDDISPAYYFVLRFVPTFITVAFGILWQITDFEVKRLEAFYQMSKEGGALAAESINVDYITLFNFTRPFTAIHRKHYAVAISSIATLLAVSLVPTLGTASIVLNPDRATRESNPLIEKTVTVNGDLSRALTAVLGVIALLGCVLFYQLQSRRSGLLGDVKGIAGLASMAVVSHILMDFKDMDTAKPKDIHHKLKDHRYVLRNSSLAPDSSSPVSVKDAERYKETHVSSNPHPLMLRASGCISLILGMLLFSGFVPAFLFTSAGWLTDNAPWVVTALAVCIKLAWGSLETSVRMMEPYYILSRRHAPPKTLTLDYTAMPFGWVAVRALFNRHWLVFLVGFGSILAELLTVFVTSLATVEGRDFISLIDPNGQHAPPNGSGGGPGGPGTPPPDAVNAGQETFSSFLVTFSLTLFILLYMCVIATATFIRRRHPFLPRQPNTISSVLAFIHQSKMLYDFVGTAKFTNAQMVGRLESLNKTYGLGWFDGRDGQTHCGVDEEELTGNYKHGIDYSLGNKPWNRDWQLF